MYVWNPDLTIRWCLAINLSPHGQNGRRFTDDIFKSIFVNKKICILIKISLKFVVKGSVEKKTAMV